MRPVEPQAPSLDEAADGHERSRRWGHTLAVILFVIVCFEVGIFLLVFPWTEQWNANSMTSLFPWLRGYWSNSFFRGALSGLGILNIYISMGELARLRRSSPPPADPAPPADKLKATTL
jgi:hypothetical protein